MVPFPGEDGILEWTGAFSPDGGTFFKAAKWLLERFDRELDNISYGRANSSGTTTVLQVTKDFLQHLESYEGRWGFPLVYTEADTDSARRLSDCAVDLLAKLESYPSFRSKDPAYPAALLMALITSCGVRPAV